MPVDNSDLNDLLKKATKVKVIVAKPKPSKFKRFIILVKLWFINLFDTCK